MIGSIGRRRSFRVTVDSVLDDPLRVLQTHRSGVRLGQSYPYTDDAVNGIVAVFFEQRRHITELDWEIDAIYDVPIFFPNATTPWIIRVRGGQETEDIEFDLDGKPIGTPEYPILSTASLGHTHTALVVNNESGGSATQVKLGTPANDATRYVEPATRYRDTGELVMVKTVGTMTTSDFNGFLEYNNKVNSDWVTVVTNISSPFATRIAGPGKLKFAPPEIIEVPGYGVGQSKAGVLWQITVAMQFDPLGWKHRVTHRYTDHTTGNRAVIKNLDGDPVYEEFRLYDTANFTQMLARF